MAELIKMPRLSDTMEEGTVATWFKKVGDKVEEGDILAEIETDKATMEFESFYEGTLLYIGIKENETAKVDVPLAIIGEEGEDIESILGDSISDDKPEEKKSVDLPNSSLDPGDNQKVEKAPEKKFTNEDKVEEDESSRSSEIIKSQRIFISPLAKKLANDKNIDISAIQGTGENGRIVKSDIENYKETIVQPHVQPTIASLDNQDFSEINHSQMRKVIAKRLSESKFSAPHYYLNVELDMSETIVFRKQCNAIPDTKISFNDIIIKACAVALRNNPSVNSQWFDDRIRYNNFVNIGVAVGVEDGLIVPVLKNADKMSVAEISKSVKEMAALARDKKLTPEMMQGSTFTISNLGMFGIESFTSIINSPNSVILSVGAIIEKPVVKDGEVVVGNTMKLTLACDHRVVDGLTGAKFLQALKPLIENPLSMLI